MSLFIGDCGSDKSPSDSSSEYDSLPAARTIASITTRGGLCSQSLGCLYKFTVYRDGRYERVLGGEKKHQKGAFPAKEIDQLNEYIQSSTRSSLTKGKFTDTCPTAVDGQEIIYTLHQSKKDKLVLETCKWNIDEDHPVFKMLRQMQLQSDYS